MFYFVEEIMYEMLCFNIQLYPKLISPLRYFRKKMYWRNDWYQSTNSRTTIMINSSLI